MLGREFAYDLLAEVSGLPEPALRDGAGRARRGDLVRRRGEPPDAVYAFRHALMPDAAYGTLLRERRRELHRRAADAIEQLRPEAAEREPEVLAHHRAEAGEAEAAAALYLRAGRRAVARSALAEAATQLRAGLKAVASLPAGPSPRGLELDLMLALAGALIAGGGYTAPETGEALTRARELCAAVDDPYRLFPVMNGQVLFHLLQGETEAASVIAAEMLGEATRRGDAALLIPAHRVLALLSTHLGHFAEARGHAERVLALYDPACHRALAAAYSFDQRTVALGYLALALLVLGHPEQARARSDELAAEVRELGHPEHPRPIAALHLLTALRGRRRGGAAADRRGADRNRHRARAGAVRDKGQALPGGGPGRAGTG